MTDFENRNREKIAEIAADADLRQASLDWIIKSAKHEYSYHFKWLGRPIIQYPQDIVAIQEILWTVKPKFVVETGIAHGGSLIFMASILQMIGEGGKVIGIDIDIRQPNRQAVEQHSMAKHITMLQGSSIDGLIVKQACELVGEASPIMVILDSNHTHDHVLQELNAYSRLVGKGSYIIVLDTIIEDMPEDSFPHRNWGRGNNPKTAVQEFLRTNPRFVVDVEYDSKLLLSVGPYGYLKCIADL